MATEDPQQLKTLYQPDKQIIRHSQVKECKWLKDKATSGQNLHDIYILLTSKGCMCENK